MLQKLSALGQHRPEALQPGGQRRAGHGIVHHHDIGRRQQTAVIELLQDRAQQRDIRLVNNQQPRLPELPVNALDVIAEPEAQDCDARRLRRIDIADQPIRLFAGVVPAGEAQFPAVFVESGCPFAGFALLPAQRGRFDPAQPRRHLGIALSQRFAVALERGGAGGHRRNDYRKIAPISLKPWHLVPESPATGRGSLTPP